MLLRNFPHRRQGNAYECGAAALQSILAYYGIDERVDRLRKIADTTQRDGTQVGGMKNTLAHFGLHFSARVMSLQDMFAYLDKKIPVIVMLQAWPKNKKTDLSAGWKDGHYAIAIGYSKKYIFFEDPSDMHRTYLSHDEFVSRWHDEDAPGKIYRHYGIAVFGTPARLKMIRMG